MLKDMANFLAMWPTMHFYLNWEQIQLPIIPLFFWPINIEIGSKLHYGGECLHARF